MQNRLSGKHVAFIAGQGVEHSHLAKPMQELRRMGAQISVIASSPDVLVTDTKETYKVDKAVAVADPEDYHAVVVSGGAEIASLKPVLEFLRTFEKSGKPVGATSQGVPVLIAAELVKDRQATFDPRHQALVDAAGGTWRDCEVVVDDLVITTRHTKDLPAFSQALAKALLD